MVAALGLLPDAGTGKKLLNAYREWGRHYHGELHLRSVLELLDRYRDLADRPAEVECALWFHDAIYSTWRGGNERRSARWASTFLTRGKAYPVVSKRIVASIEATEHAQTVLADNNDTALVLDIDLIILGADVATYTKFEQQIRREYWWVPKRRYRKARRKVLEAFLARPQIYHHVTLRATYEIAARRNLAQAIAALEV
jgi:predicted metal-dependent HD superfamily phosphohydrolase